MTRRNNVKWKRKDGKMTFIVKSEKFISYTMKITRKANRFPKKTTFTLVNRAVNYAWDAHDFLLEANAIYPLTSHEADERLALQKKAITQCQKLDFLIRESYANNYIEDNELKYWSYLLADMRKQITSWHEADKKRYKNM